MELEVLRQRNAELEAKIAELEEVWRMRVTLQEEKIAELNFKNGTLVTENFDLKNENAKLRRELQNRIEDHETRLAKVEHGSSTASSSEKDHVTEISVTARHENSENADDVSGSIVDQSSNANTKSSEEKLRRESETAVDMTPDDDSTHNNANTKLTEERENEHQREHSIQNKEARSHKKKEAENIVQDVFDFTAASSSEKNHVTEISVPARHENSDTNSPDCLQHLACLFQEACDASDKAIQANQKELLCWRSYIIEFDRKTVEITNKYKIGEKKAKGMIYDNLIKLLPGTKREKLRKQTQRARKIYEFFGKIGVDKIKYIKTYSANSISELTNSQIQTIIDHFTAKPNMDFTDNPEEQNEDNSSNLDTNQINASEVRANISISAKIQRFV